MASWQSPGLGPARPLTVTLAPRAQLGSRPGPRRRELGLAWGWREWKQSRPWLAGSLAGQLLTWETCPTSPGWQGLSTLPGTHCPSHGHWQVAWHHCPVCPTGQGQCPLLGVGAALSLEPGSLFVPGAGSGWAPHCPQLAVCPQPPLLPGSAAFGFVGAPSLPGPISLQEQIA